MIDPQQAASTGVEVTDSSKIMQQSNLQLIEQLKALLPSIINADNQLNVSALQDLVDIANSTNSNKGYELTFAGKWLARAEATRPTAFELHAELKQSKNFDTTENVVIRGDNVDVLKILYQNYHNKIKMIYIDPPYNTKSENFIYKDNFKQSDADLIEAFGMDEDTTDFLHNVYGTRSHSSWLAFMYPRLKLARELLSDDGVIFISIDDNEQANLKVLCDEIFGEDNFVSLITRATGTPTGGGGNKPIVNEVDYMFVYSKSHNLSFTGTKLSDEEKGIYNKSDQYGTYLIRSLRRTGGEDRREDRPTMFYPIISPDGSNIFPIGPTGYESRWICSEEKFHELCEKNLIEWKKGDNNRWVVYQKFYLENRLKQSGNLWSKVEGNKKATKDVRDLFNGKKIFTNPKPVKFIMKALQISTVKNDVVLDFFAGSGTTADAVMQLNAEDGGNRKFILAQWDETIDQTKNTEAYNFCTDNQLEPVISSITIERINRAGEKIKEELPSDKALPDIGCKVYSLINKPEILQQDPNPNATKDRFTMVNHRKNSLDTLTNMLCASCKPLTTKIECIEKDCLYKTEDAIYLLRSINSEQLTQYSDLAIYIDGWADIDLEDYLNLDIIDKENISVVY